jgi:uncharacterized protein (DUF1499 family)
MNTITGRMFVMTIGLLGMLGCAGERPQNLGTKDGQLAACPSSPNCVSSQAADDGHRITALTFTGDPDASFARLKLVLGRRGDTAVIEEKPGYLRVEFRTILFVDDGEFLLDRECMVIQVRSASRLGYSDLGKNRKRMEEIRSQFSAAEGKP